MPAMRRAWPLAITACIISNDKEHTGLKIEVIEVVTNSIPSPVRLELVCVHETNMHGRLTWLARFTGQANMLSSHLLANGQMVNLPNGLGRLANHIWPN